VLQQISHDYSELISALNTNAVSSNSNSNSIKVHRETMWLLKYF